MKKSILLPIETTCRELSSKVLLAHKFASNNCSAFIGDKGSILNFSKYIPGSVYFDKGYHKGVSENIYEELINNHIVIVSLDEENAVDFKDFQQLNLRFPNHILNKFHLIFLWGTKQKIYLKNNRTNYDKKTVLVSGHPRFQLLRQEFRSIYQKEVDLYMKEYGKFVLINTNFGLGNNVKGDQFIVSNYGPRFPQIKSLMSYQKKQVDNLIDLCKKLSKALRYRIIVRPHPEECHKIYEDNLQEFSNVEIISKGSAIPWIIASDLMIHHDCTTALECAMLGKNSIAYIKDLDSKLTTDIPLRVSYKYHKADHVIDHIRSSDKMALKINSEILDEYFSFNSNSVDIITDEILKIDNCDELAIRNYSYYQMLTNIKNKLRKYIGATDNLHEKKMEGLDLESIEFFIDKFNTIFSKSIRVIKIHDKLYKCFKS